MGVDLVWFSSETPLFLPESTWMILKRHSLQFWVGFYFLCHILTCFLFIAAFTFLCFITASFLIFSFSFWSASFFAFSCSILFIILKFSSLVIQKLWNIFFLIVCFLMKVGTSIKSSKEKLLPILKNLFIYRSRLCTSSLFFFTLLIFILFLFHYYSFSTFHHALN